MISLVLRRLVCCSAAFLIGPFAVGQQNPLSSNDHLRAAANIPPLSSPATPPLTPELRGDIYMARKMYREAIDMYREGPQDSPVIVNKIGIAFHQLLLLDLAKKNYEHAIKLNPKYSEAINNLGTIYYSRKNYKHAITLYKRALKYGTPTASIYANLGTAYFARKDYKQATVWYEQALKLDPDVFDHHSAFGTVMQERTIEERAMFHLYLAKMYARSGANDRAIIYLRKALEEGVKDRKKIPDMPEFASLKTDPAFKQLLAEDPKPL